MEDQKETSKKEEMPYCFGRMDVVFPMGNDGLRHTPESCMHCCRYKTECLRKAMAGKDGFAAREELVDRAYEHGRMGFFERWSKKKYLSRKSKS